MLARARQRLGPAATLERMVLPDLTVEGIFDAAVCTLDGFNHLTADALRGTLKALARRLRPGGWLVFDLHTDALLDFTMRNPVSHSGESDGTRFKGSTSTVDPVARTCDTRIEVTHPREGAPFTEQHRQYFHRDTDVRAALAVVGLRGDRRHAGLHSRARRRLDAARDLDRPPAGGLREPFPLR